MSKNPDAKAPASPVGGPDEPRNAPGAPLDVEALTGTLAGLGMNVWIFDETGPHVVAAEPIEPDKSKLWSVVDLHGYVDGWFETEAQAWDFCRDQRKLGYHASVVEPDDGDGPPNDDWLNPEA